MLETIKSVPMAILTLSNWCTGAYCIHNSPTATVQNFQLPLP